MKIYLDDDSIAALLVQTLRGAGHDVRTPADAGLSGAADPVHFRRAIGEGRLMLSRNFRDFERLHLLIQEAKGSHPGVLIVRRDNPKRRNMSPFDVVRALRNLATSGLPLVNAYIRLNVWQ
jgi:predicted nuclease of predicted toxin-antitoxin system